MSQREQKRIRQLERKTAVLELELAEIREYINQPVTYFTGTLAETEEPPKKGLFERLADALKGE